VSTQAREQALLQVSEHSSCIIISTSSRTRAAAAERQQWGVTTFNSKQSYSTSYILTASCTVVVA
jgi:hypothetical protein